jgi:5-deoxy-D-glucuronate isomerase
VKVAADPARRLTFAGIGEVERPLEVAREQTGWDAPTARAYQYRAGQVIDGDAEGDEMVMVLIDGELALSATGLEERVAGRHDPLADAATILYLPPGASYRAEIRRDARVLYCRAAGTPAADGRPAWIGAALDASVSVRLRIREDVVAAGTWATLPLGTPGIVYHRFGADDGFALTATAGGEAVAVRDGDAVVLTRPGYQLAVAPTAALLAVTVTAAS